MATRQKAAAADKAAADKAASGKSRYEVTAVGVPRRCRAGHCFDGSPREVVLTSSEAKAISDDPYLSVVALGRGEK